MPSRRHNLQSGPVYRAILREGTHTANTPAYHPVVCLSLPAGTYRTLLSVVSLDSSPLWRATTIMWNRCYIRDGADAQSGLLQCADRGFASGSGTLYKHVDLAHAVFQRFTRRNVGTHLRGIWGALPTPVEPSSPSAAPAHHAAGRISNRHNSIIKSRVDMRLSNRHILPFAAPSTYRASPLCGALGISHFAPP
ncbi:MAG: hypothetical protein JWO59_1388 [Chloroflexi bacterium]|nr:hypothetical protein [Chloroflexota bacterium]